MSTLGFSNITVNGNVALTANTYVATTTNLQSVNTTDVVSLYTNTTGNINVGNTSGNVVVPGNIKLSGTLSGNKCRQSTFFNSTSIPTATIFTLGNFTVQIATGPVIQLTAINPCTAYYNSVIHCNNIYYGKGVQTLAAGGVVLTNPNNALAGDLSNMIYELVFFDSYSQNLWKVTMFVTGYSNNNSWNGPITAVYIGML